MSENTNITTADSGNTPDAGVKTFSQDDVNRIVSERLQKERQKADSTLVEREQQLIQRELLFTAKEKITALGLPADLADALNITSADALDKALSILSKHYKNIENTSSTPVIVGATPAYGTVKPSLDNSGGIRGAFGLN